MYSKSTYDHRPKSPNQKNGITTEVHPAMASKCQNLNGIRNTTTLPRGI